MRPQTRDAAKWFALIAISLLAVYSSTFLYPYLLTDEAWIIRPGTYTWTYSMGRPVFALFSWVSAKIFDQVGLDVIYAMRLSGVIGLSFAALVLMRWFEFWGHDRLTSFCLAIAVMTLPAYQIVVADGTQLATAIFLTVLATHYFFVASQRSLSTRSVITGVLMLAALLIYQQQLLVGFAMLSVPLLRQPTGKAIYKPLIAYGAVVTLVSLLYFVVWKVTYRQMWPERVDTRYGPDAVRLPSLDQFMGFLDARFPQVANLWNVNTPSFNLIVAVVCGLILGKILTDLTVAPTRYSIARFAMLFGLLIACDGFSILARAYPSYITATALSLLVFYWAFSGAAVLLSKRTVYGAAAVAGLGCFMAFWTVKHELAVPNWQHMSQIRQAILSHPDALNFHIVGTMKGGPAYQEFGWRNAATDVYLNLIAIDVADDLSKTGLISVQRRTNMYISVGGVVTWSAPESTPRKTMPDSIIVNLQ